MEIKKEGLRKDVKDLFKVSGLFDGVKLKHGFFISFDEKEGIKVSRNSNDLLVLDDDVEVITQWKGKWSSDIFIFKAGEYKEYYKNKTV